MVRRPEVMSAYLAREAEAKRMPKHILKLLRYLLIFSALGGAFSIVPFHVTLFLHSVAGITMAILIGRWMLQWEAVSELILAEPDTVKRAVRKFGILLVSWGALSAVLLLTLF
jgi:hypothetical protein